MDKCTNSNHQPSETWHRQPSFSKVKERHKAENQMGASYPRLVID